MKFLLVYLHGSGSSGDEMIHSLHNFEFNYQNYQNLDELLTSSNMTLYCPTAHPIPYSYNDNNMTTVWFNRASDFTSLGTQDSYEDKEGMMKSRQLLIDEIKQVDYQQGPFDRIILGGSSMGGAMALQFLCDADPFIANRLAGIVVNGSFLVNSSGLYERLDLYNKSYSPLQKPLPVHMIHGRRDSLINPKWSEETYYRLSRYPFLNVTHSWVDEADHQMTSEMLNLVAEFLVTVVTTEEQSKMYQIVPLELPNQYKVQFTFSQAIPAAIISNPILACGSSFHLSFEGSGNVISTEINSPDPHKTAFEIGRRLVIRINNGGCIENPCCIS